MRTGEKLTVTEYVEYTGSKLEFLGSLADVRAKEQAAKPAE